MIVPFTVNETAIPIRRTANQSLASHIVKFRFRIPTLVDGATNSANDPCRKGAND